MQNGIVRFVRRKIAIPSPRLRNASPGKPSPVRRSPRAEPDAIELFGLFGDCGELCIVPASARACPAMALRCRASTHCDCLSARRAGGGDFPGLSSEVNSFVVMRAIIRPFWPWFMETAHFILSH
jgi:hypothetical protein